MGFPTGGKANALTVEPSEQVKWVALVFCLVLCCCGTEGVGVTHVTAIGEEKPTNHERNWLAGIPVHAFVKVKPIVEERRFVAVAEVREKPEPVERGSRCGGDLPPCWVMNRESGGNIHAYNPTGCSGRGCYGKWQCDPDTCKGTGSEEEQDAEARRIWDNGKGCSHWAACGGG